VEQREELRDGAVELVEAEERLIAQPCEDPALDDLYGDLSLRLVARLRDTRRQNRDTVVRGHLGVRRVDIGLIAMRLRDAALEVINDDALRDAADVGEGAWCEPIQS